MQVFRVRTENFITCRADSGLNIQASVLLDAFKDNDVVESEFGDLQFELFALKGEALLGKGLSVCARDRGIRA